MGKWKYQLLNHLFLLTRHQKFQEYQRFLKMPYQNQRRKRCLVPRPNAPRIGDVAQNKKEKVFGFELQNVNGQQICVTLYEPIPFTEQYLPAPQVVASTAGIAAAVATTSALLAKPVADLLLKVVKPLVKKAIKKSCC